MQIQVSWKKRAIRSLNAAVEQGLINFGERVVGEFYREIKRNDVRLAANPYLGAAEPLLVERRMEYRSLVVHEHYKLIYYIDSKQQHLYVADLWDTRREPGSLSRRIKK